MKKLKYIIPVVGWLAVSGIAFGQATQSPIQEQPAVRPQIDIVGEGIATLDLGQKNDFGFGGLSSGSQINISDSALLFGMSQKLYHGGVGSFVLGGLTVDQSNVGTGVNAFLHEAFLDYQEKAYEVCLGRTDLPTAQLIQFPTLRSDDLTEFLVPTNPFSNGDNVEEQRYGNVAAVELNKGLHQFVNIHAAHLIDSEGVNGSNGTGLNSVGLSYQYKTSPGLETLNKIRTAGIGFEHRSLGSSFGGNSDLLYGGASLTLKKSMVQPITLRVLDSYTFGNSTSSLTSLNDGFRADANSIAVSLQYMNQPFGKPSYSLALTGGYRKFSKLNANEYALALTGQKQIGEGFSAIAQLSYIHRSAELAAAYGQTNSFVFQIGFSFTFDSVFNQQVAPRRSPINLLHNYLPQ